MQEWCCLRAVAVPAIKGKHMRRFSWSHLLFQKVKILSSFRSKVAMDKIPLQSLSAFPSPSILSEDFIWKSKLPQAVWFLEMDNGLLWCSLSPKGVRNMYCMILLCKKTTNKARCEYSGYSLWLGGLWWSWALGTVIAVSTKLGLIPAELHWFTRHPLFASRKKHMGQLGIHTPTGHTVWLRREPETTAWCATYPHVIYIHLERPKGQNSDEWLPSLKVHWTGCNWVKRLLSASHPQLLLPVSSLMSSLPEIRCCVANGFLNKNRNTELSATHGFCRIHFQKLCICNC